MCQHGPAAGDDGRAWSAWGSYYAVAQCAATTAAVCRSLTGINGSSEGIVGVLVRGDTASALNISLGSVQVSRQGSKPCLAADT